VINKKVLFLITSFKTRKSLFH